MSALPEPTRDGEPPNQASSPLRRAISIEPLTGASATPLNAQSTRALPLPDASFAPHPARNAQATHATTIVDARGRPLRDLRISITDRCNFRCGYCMPRAAFGPEHKFLPHADLLSFEEITRAAGIFLSLGVRKLHLTGGEPLMRKGVEALVASLAALRTPQGDPPEIALTTNGSLLADKVRSLRVAGLQRLTVSLDALDEAAFQRMSDSKLGVRQVLHGIEAAQAAGLGPIKVNMVVQKGVNDDQILPMARHFRGSGIELRFIEFMDVGHTNRWDMAHVLPSDAVRDLIHAVHPLTPVSKRHTSDTAQRWAYADGQGHVGFISSVTQAFCSDCTRLRLSTEGVLYSCLFATQGHDLRALLRAPEGCTDEAIASRLTTMWSRRDDRYSELRGRAGSAPVVPGMRIEMSYIGG